MTTTAQLLALAPCRDIPGRAEYQPPSARVLLPRAPPGFDELRTFAVVAAQVPNSAGAVADFERIDLNGPRLRTACVKQTHTHAQPFTCTCRVLHAVMGILRRPDDYFGDSRGSSRDRRLHTRPLHPIPPRSNPRPSHRQPAAIVHTQEDIECFSSVVEGAPNSRHREQACHARDRAHTRLLAHAPHVCSSRTRHTRSHTRAPSPTYSRPAFAASIQNPPAGNPTNLESSCSLHQPSSTRVRPLQPAPNRVDLH